MFVIDPFLNVFVCAIFDTAKKTREERKWEEVGIDCKTTYNKAQ